MDRYAIIENGNVANVALADAEFAAEQGWIAAPDSVAPGWSYDGQEFVPPPDPAPTVPATISDRQFFQQLALLGKITQAEALDAVGPGIIPASMGALIDMLPAEQQFTARMLLSGATSFERHHPLTPVLGGMYGLADDDLDALWIAGAAL
ncbi:hypothetical protein [Alteraurantiacibacter buctensis]|uniref:Uncharacterized protein n=1 Tax=Alteraurantiacibacter buctensis TaxID=1503981 RepID=A0A844Z2L5_9SPHN|nr:hypothetical protein [Alteraurantiacibacter buctensis]MXO73588.1 hypothetical protein [Alteraurantiacibacter buctensis]